MKLKTLFASVLLAGACMTGAKADAVKMQPKPTNTPHQVYMGLDQMYRDYSERIAPPGKSDEYGYLPGFQIGYDYIQSSRMYFGADGRIVAGKTRYDGTLLFSNKPHKSRTTNAFLNFEARSGYTFDLAGTQVIPFFGYGYHYWDRKLSASQKEIYDWQYLAVGVRTLRPLSDAWAVGLNLKVMGMIHGRMEFREPTPLNGRSVNLGNKAQFEAELPIEYTLPTNKTVSIRFVPYYRNQPIGQSNVILGYLEPSSRTHVYGGRIDLVKKF